MASLIDIVMCYWWVGDRLDDPERIWYGLRYPGNSDGDELRDSVHSLSSGNAVEDIPMAVYRTWYWLGLTRSICRKTGG